MAKKLVVLFVMCIVVVAAMHAHHAEATGTKDLDTFKNCYVNCQDHCNVEKDGYAHCEWNCNTKCQKAVEQAAKLNRKLK